MDGLLDYRGFKGSACFDRRSIRHFGMVMDVPHAILYEALSSEGLIANFEAAIDEYIDLLDSIENDLSESIFDRPAVTIIVSHVAEAA